MNKLDVFKLMLINTLFLSLIHISFIGIISYIIRVYLPFWVYLLLFISFFSATYLIFNWVLNKIIYKRIKLIYKSIRTVKTRNPGGKIKRQSIEEVEHEVANWQKNQQKEIEQLKKMEKFRQQYIGNVSHELKTPIFNIQGYLETLVDMPDRQTPIFDSFLAKALKNTKRLHTIVEDLQMISKSETENLSLQWQIFSIKELIAQVYDELEMQANEQLVQLQFKTLKCPDFDVYADRERIYQVLVNLISNAIKYNRENGKVIASCYEMDDHILIEITDTGIGIKQKHLKHLFERFYRVDKNRSRKKGGAGLGLAIVKHIIEAHNELVHVRSTPGIGTTFGFTLQKANSQTLPLSKNQI